MQEANPYNGKIQGNLRKFIIGNSLSDNRAQLPARLDVIKETCN